jgi:hypothetical protein
VEKYYGVFANNNEAKVDEFFHLKVVRKFWDAVLPFMTMKLFFLNKAGEICVNHDLTPTFRKIT